MRSLHANVAAVACTAAAVSVYVADDRELAVHRIDLSSVKRDGAAVSIDCSMCRLLLRRGQVNGNLDAAVLSKQLNRERDDAGYDLSIT